MIKKAAQLIREGYQVLTWTTYNVVLVKCGPGMRKKYAWVNLVGRVYLEIH